MSGNSGLSSRRTSGVRTQVPAMRPRAASIAARVIGRTGGTAAGMRLSLTLEGARPGPHLVDEEVGFLHRREVAAAGHVGPADDVVGALGEGPRRGLVERLAGEVGEGG